VALSEAFDVLGMHVFDTSFIDLSWCDVSSSDEISEPFSSIRIHLVVISPVAHQ
jgi:hypothetical protein